MVDQHCGAFELGTRPTTPLHKSITPMVANALSIYFREWSFTSFPLFWQCLTPRRLASYVSLGQARRQFGHHDSRQPDLDSLFRFLLGTVTRPTSRKENFPMVRIPRSSLLFIFILLLTAPSQAQNWSAEEQELIEAIEMLTCISFEYIL